ncbi:MAG TPA: fructosamine kinase family protein [Pseudonocardia sp.]|nr:fructosamine kinase family protein [Pseudonocardia sp.]
MTREDPSDGELEEAVRRLTGEAPRAVDHAGHLDGSLVRVELADGRLAVLKSAPRQPGQLTAEVAGLRWLGEPEQVGVPAVLGHDADWLLMEYLPPARPDRAAATRFGRALAQLHAAGAPAFGAAPPGGPDKAWIGLAPMHNVPGEHWPDWYVEHRVRPYLRLASDAGQLTAEQTDVIDSACRVLPEVAGPPVAPARLHGDLWSGNVCWSSGPRGESAQVEGWVIDPAAHGGHPETDLAMLALFGCPHPDAVFDGYQQISPLAPGWPGRVGLHQLFPLLVHVALFGRGYAERAVAAARSTVALADGLP